MQGGVRPTRPPHPLPALASVKRLLSDDASRSFSKKHRSDQLADDAIHQDLHSCAHHSVDLFAREAPSDPLASVKASNQDAANQRNDALSSNRNSQRISTQQQQQQQQQKREALDRISDLICLSVEHQTQLPRSRIGASSPRFPSASPSMPDHAFFYPVEAPPSPTSIVSSSNGSQRRASIIAFPSRIDSQSGLRLNMSGDFESTRSGSSMVSPSLSASSTQADSTLRECLTDASYHSGGNARSYDAIWPSRAESHETHTEPFQLLLPSSMKRPPSKTMESDASKKSNASLTAELGHGSEQTHRSKGERSHVSTSQNQFDWLLMEEIRRPSQPPPPLRPSRNPMRNRSKSLCSATVGTRSSSPPPPMPSLPGASPPQITPAVNATGLVGPCNLTPVHTPPRSRPASSHRHQAHARCDSLTSAASAASSASLRAACFHTPTFGSNSWTTLPVS